MNIDNIALVRATNIIPFDGVVRPLSNSRYLCKNIGLEYSARLSVLLRNVGIIPPIDQTRLFEEDYYDSMVSLSSKILRDYLPYVSDYNSMVLFSLNGICPDDNEHGFANNTFSNKKVAIIEPLNKHIDQVISLVPTDTAIKGDIVLSNEAIVLIDKDTYSLLNEEQKAVLHNNQFNIKTFTGSLKDAITEELQASDRYIPETLSLSASTGGFMPSSTSEAQKQLINNIAETLGLSQQKYFNLITSTDKNMPKYADVSDEYNKMLKIQEYYMKMFLDELLEYLNAPNTMAINSSNQLYSEKYMSDVVNLIEYYGIENYKKFVDAYNFRMEEKQANGSLPTPQEVINEINQQKRQYQ